MKLRTVLLALCMAIPPAAWAQAACPARDAVTDAATDQPSLQASAYLARAARSTARRELDKRFTQRFLLDRIYAPCSFALLWTIQGKPTPQAIAVMQQFEMARQKGLRPGDYGWPAWSVRAAALQGPGKTPLATRLAQFDLGLTSALLRFLCDLSTGRVDPRTLKVGLDVRPQVESMASYIPARIAGSSDVAAAIQQVEPSSERYLRIEAELDRYLALAATGNIALPPFRKTIRAGDALEWLPQLATRLKKVGDLPSDFDAGPPPFIYQGSLVNAVMSFQQRHGLEPDGAIGPATYQQLLVPLNQRAIQLALTLERWRWVPRPFTEPPIVVNIPEFILRAYDQRRQVVLRMPVIVGRAYRKRRRTPIFEGKISSVILRPYWNVPLDIQQNEIAPKLAKNLDYLEKNSFEVLDARGTILNAAPASLLPGIRNGSLKVRQVPGPENSLGLIKFVFPNSYSVYMHGTPEQVLFGKSRRDFSHGCIRVEDPVSLAVWVLRQQPDWPRDRIEAATAGEETITIPLQSPIPVLILYGTALVEEDGKVHFFQDIYGYDLTLERALDRISAERAARRSF